MSISSDASNDPDGTVFDRLRRKTPPTRYDLVLALIPAVFALTLTTAAVVGLSLQTALTGASMVGVLAVLDALFINPPTRGRRRPGA